MTNHNSLAALIKKLRRDIIVTQWLPKLRYSHLQSPNVLDGGVQFNNVIFNGFTKSFYCLMFR